MSKRKKEKVFGVVCAATADNIYYFPVIFSAKDTKITHFPIKETFWIFDSAMCSVGSLCSLLGAFDC